MKSDTEKFSKSKKVLGLLIGISAITMMIVDCFIKYIDFDSLMLVIVLVIGIVIFNSSTIANRKDLDPKKQKIIQSILIVVVVLGIIAAIIAT